MTLITQFLGHNGCNLVLFTGEDIAFLKVQIAWWIIDTPLGWITLLCIHTLQLLLFHTLHCI